MHPLFLLPQTTPTRRVGKLAMYYIALILLACATPIGGFGVVPLGHHCQLVQRACPLVMAEPQLTGSQRRSLRAHAGRLAASKQLNYVSVVSAERSAEEVDRQLAAVELVRCRFAVDKKAEAKVMAAALATQTGAAVAEVLGHTALLYRPSARHLITLDGL